MVYGKMGERRNWNVRQYDKLKIRRSGMGRELVILDLELSVSHFIENKRC